MFGGSAAGDSASCGGGSFCWGGTAGTPDPAADVTSAGPAQEPEESSSWLSGLSLFEDLDGD